MHERHLQEVKMVVTRIERLREGHWVMDVQWVTLSGDQVGSGESLTARGATEEEAVDALFRDMRVPDAWR